MNNQGTLLVVSGFSGAGKGTVIKELLKEHDNYSLSISATTRKPREGEQDGREYFFKTKEEFEKWHKNICEEICRRFSSLPDINLKFGKAQKLINISFKHLYCFADSDSKAEHFKYCHIPIDSNVISWCNKNAGIRKPQTAWSNLSYDDYHKFQECLSMWLNSDANTEYRDSDGIPYSLLQLDFIAWISVPDTRKGIIDTWQKFRNTSELWDKYEETVLSVFSELSK